MTTPRHGDVRLTTKSTRPEQNSSTPAECPLRSGGARRGVADSGYVKRWSPKIVRVRPPRPPHNGRAVERATADGAHPPLRYNPPQPTRSPRRTPIHPQNGTTETQRETPRNRPSRNHSRPRTRTPHHPHSHDHPTGNPPPGHHPRTARTGLFARGIYECWVVAWRFRLVYGSFG